MGVKPQRMEYEEINMLAELHIDLGEYSQAMTVIHNGICGNELHSYESFI
jgi:hypothetical protein